MFPAASVAVARNVVVLPAATVTVSPGDANAAAVPVAAGEPVQPAVGYSLTVVPGLGGALHRRRGARTRRGRCHARERHQAGAVESWV